MSNKQHNLNKLTKKIRREITKIKRHENKDRTNNAFVLGAMKTVQWQHSSKMSATSTQ